MDRSSGYASQREQHTHNGGDLYRDSSVDASSHGGMEQSANGWASGSSADHAHHMPSQSYQDNNPFWQGDYSGPHKPAPAASQPPAFQVIASQGFGHHDHLYNRNQVYPNPSQAYSTPQPLSPPREPMPDVFVHPAQPRQHAWVLPILVVSGCVIMFIVEMIVNNCPENLKTENEQCVLRFLGRLSFQPLRENPLFGPSTTALLHTGALESDRVVHGGQGWRLVTCMWLHAGVIHLLANLLGLWWIGVPLEREFGPWKIGAIYLLSGFAGSLLSALFLLNQISVGASGALFGLLGATLSELIINWNRYTNRVAALFSLLLIIAVNLMLGLMPYVDNFAHLGGFAAGVLLGLVLLVQPQQDWEQLRDNPVMYSLSEQRRKYSPCQNITRIVALLLFLAGYVAAIAALFSGVDANEGCSWCHYLSCVPTSLWECSSSSPGDSIQCRLLTNADGSRDMICANGTSHPIASNASDLSALCLQFCGS